MVRISFTISIFLFLQTSFSDSSVLPPPSTGNLLNSIVSSKIKTYHPINSAQKDALPSNDSKVERPVEPPLLVGSFNIQTLVKRKFKNLDVMYVVEKVILRYDLILILEIHTDEDHFMETLLKDVNLMVPSEQSYKMVLSERKAETKEHYAFLYRKNKLRLIAAESYDDPEVFYRKPLIAIFEAFTLRDMKKFGAVGQHVKPSEAVREINGLADVYDYIKWKYETEDVLLMGDFNADCAYVKESHWDDIALWYRSEFTWAITGKVDTTTNYKSCALDRFVYAGENMNDGVILSSAGIFDYQEEFHLTVYEVRNISDHWPIELKIRGKLSEKAEKYLTTDICFHVQDTQKRKNITENIMNLAKKYSFNATKVADGILLRNVSKEEENMLDAITSLRLGLPGLISYELAEAIKYKVNHGTLNDESSFADVNHYRYTINILSTNKLVEASICRTTSVN